MTDLETIFGYRIRQTEETLSEAVSKHQAVTGTNKTGFCGVWQDSRTSF